MKRKIALVLLLMQLLSVFSPLFDDYNFAVPSVYDEYKTSSTPIKLPNKNTGDEDSLYLNNAVYSKYGIWVYGSPNTFGDYSAFGQSWEYNATLDTWEPRYLGFNSVKAPVSNDDFPNDYNMTTDIDSRNYTHSDEATKSWNDNKVTTYHKDRFYTDEVYNDDGNDGNYVGTDMSIKENLISASDWTNYVSHMISPNLTDVGVFRLWHVTSTGKLLYDTMQIAKDPDSIDIGTEIALYGDGRLKLIDEKKRIYQVTVPHDFDQSVYTFNSVVESIFTLKNNVFNGTTYKERFFIEAFEQRFNGLETEANGKSYSSQIYNGTISSTDKTYTYPISLPVPRAGQSNTYNFSASTTANMWAGHVETSNKPTITVTIKKNGLKETDFAIKDTHSSGSVFTDKNIEVNDLNFTTPKTLYLESSSYIVDGNFTNYAWFVKRSSGTWYLFKNGSSPNAEFTITSDNKSSYVTDDKIEFKLVTSDDAGLPDESEIHFTGFYKAVPLKPANDPVALLTGKSRMDEGNSEDSNTLYVMAGGEVKLDARDSYVTEEGAKIVDYAFGLSSAAKIVRDNSDRGKMTITFPHIDTPDEFTDVWVTDSNGNSQTSDTMKIKILEPELDLKISATGTKKENRKVTISLEDSEFPKHYPIDPQSVNWTITALDGQANAYTAPSGTDGNETFDIQFHDYGRYKIEAHAEIYSQYAPSETRVSDTASLILMIAEDQEPVIKYAVNKLTYRNPNESNLARVDIENLSYSPDNDKLDPAYLYMYYDSDDNGFYADETRELLTTNLMDRYTVYIDKNRVGRVKFEVIGAESPNQPYITWKSSYVKSSTSDDYMPVGDQTTLIDNIAPVVLLDAEKKEEIQILLATDKTGIAYSGVVSELNALKADLIQKNYSVTSDIATDTFELKTFTESKYEYKRTAKIQVDAYDYEDDEWGTFSRSFYMTNFVWDSVIAWETDPLPVIRAITVPATPAGSEYNKRVEYSDGDLKYLYSMQDYTFTAEGRTEKIAFANQRRAYNGGSEWDYGKISNPKAIVNGSWVKGDELETRTTTVYGLDYAAIESHNWNEDAKKILIISSANDYTTAQTNENFKAYIEANDIQVLYSGNLDAIKFKVFDNGTPKEIFKIGEAYYIDTYEGAQYSYNPSVQDAPVRVDMLPYENITVDTRQTRIAKSKSLTDNPVDFNPYPKDYYNNPYACVPSWKSWTYDDNKSKWHIPYLNGTTMKITLGNSYEFKDDSWKHYDSTFYYKETLTLATGVSEIIDYSYGAYGLVDYILYKRSDGKVAVWTGTINGRYSTDTCYMDLGSRKYNFSYDDHLVYDKYRSTSVTISTFNWSNVDVVYGDYNAVYFYDDIKGNAWMAKSGSGLTQIASGYKSRNGLRLCYEDGSFQLDSVKAPASYEVFDAIRFDEKIYAFYSPTKIYSYGPYNYLKEMRWINYHQPDAYEKKIIRCSADYNIIYRPDYGDISHFAFAVGYGTDVRFARMYRFDTEPVKYAFRSYGTNYYVSDERVFTVDVTQRQTSNITERMKVSENIFPNRFEPLNGAIPFAKIISISPDNNTFASDSELFSFVKQEYAGQAGFRTLTVVVGDEIEISSISEDYENDPIKRIAWDFIHDPTYFENSTTLHPQSGLSMSKAITKFDYPGRYVASVKGQDDPIHDQYDKWSVNSAEYEIISHRLPVARLDYNLQETDTGYQAAFDGGDSYDLDRESQANKGIEEYEYRYRSIADLDWNVSTDKTLILDIEKNVEYDVFFRVKDMQGAYSDWKHAEILITDEPFELNARISPEYPKAVAASETITVDAEVITTKDIQTVTAAFDGAPFTLSYVSTSGMSKLYRGTYTIPAGKADLDPYDVIVTAKAADDTTDVNRLSVNVETPINLSGKIAPDEAGKGQSVTLSAQTTRYATSTTATLFYGTSYAVTRTLSGMTSGDLKSWLTNYTLTQNAIEGDYEVYFSSKTANGNREAYTDTFRYDPNSAPTVLITGISPSSVFKGDSVTINCIPRDADGDRLDLTFEYSTDGGATRYLIATMLSVTQGGEESIMLDNVDISTYDIYVTAYDPKGASGQDQAAFTVTPNQPPTVQHIGTDPEVIYVSDDVTLNFFIEDPDGDEVTLVVEISKDEGASWEQTEVLSIASGSVHSVKLEDVGSESNSQSNSDSQSQSGYVVRVTVTDPYGEQASAETAFSVGTLSVNGIVMHTDKWNSNRIAFNQSKTGTDDAPRSLDVYWPGEMFILEAASTEIADGSDVFCQSLAVEIIDWDFQTRLSQGDERSADKRSTSTSISESGILWTGQLWDESMIEWKSGSITFRFTATYSNGAVIVDTATVQIDDSEAYWRHHRIF